MNSIPADMIVKVTPSVISAGGTALDLNAVFLTSSTRVPFGQAVPFASGDDVSNYFGPLATETTLAYDYFKGYVNSNRRPGLLYFFQYNTAAVAAFLRSGQVSGYTLPQLQAISGILSLSINGTTATTGNISLAGATSFSSAATLIQSAIAAVAAGTTVTYDSVIGAFVVTSSVAGTGSSLGFATGTAADALKLSSAAGAVQSPGGAVSTPQSAMSLVKNSISNWAAFMTCFEPSNTDKLAFATWNDNQNNRYLYACWDTDASAKQANASNCFGQLVKTAGLSGTAIQYYEARVAALICGYTASVDFTERNGRTTAAYRSLSGLSPSVSNQTDAVNLEANGYNYYGIFATGNDQFQFLRPGQVSGPFAWLDSYINQIWMNNQLQLALVTMMVQAKSIPYNDEGYTLIKASCQDVINQAVDFGAIRAGVTLSSLQAQDVNNSAGVRISDILSTRGWYLQVRDATPQVRAARQSPPCTLWYMDGGSIQSINLASVQLQ